MHALKILDRFLDNIHYLQSDESSDNDVLLNTGAICILKPDANRGIIVYHHIIPGRYEKNEIKRTGNLTVESFINFQTPSKSYTPCPSNPSIDDINMNYTDKMKLKEKDKDQYFFIRIDPNLTSVYSPEYKYNEFPVQWELNKLELILYQQTYNENTEPYKICITHENAPQIPSAWRVFPR